LIVILKNLLNVEIDYLLDLEIGVRSCLIKVLSSMRNPRPQKKNTKYPNGIKLPPLQSKADIP
jgi:hypothetical protein